MQNATKGKVKVIKYYTLINAINEYHQTAIFNKNINPNENQL